MEKKDDLKKTSSSPSSPSDKIPMWHYSGREYPYYMIEMGEGTPCELMNGQPRSIKLRFICDPEAHHTGSVRDVCVCERFFFFFVSVNRNLNVFLPPVSAC